MREREKGEGQRSKRSFGAQRRHPLRADAHFASFLGLVRRPRAGSRRYFSINFFSPCPVSLCPNVRVFWGTRAAPDIDRVLVYTREGSNRADTEAKWSRINQRRPIINELRLRPPRVCIKTRLFVTHLSRVRPVPRSAFVITLRRQTVSIRRRGLYTKARVGPAVSSRERATRGFFLRVLLPPFVPSRSPFFPTLVLLRARGHFDWLYIQREFFFACALYRPRVLRDDTEARALSRRKGGIGRGHNNI